MQSRAAVGFVGRRSLSLAAPVLHLKKAELPLPENTRADLQALLTKARWTAQQDLEKEQDAEIRKGLEAEVRLYDTLTPTTVYEQAAALQKVRVQLASLRKYPDVSWERMQEVREELLQRYEAAGGAERMQENLKALNVSNNTLAGTALTEPPMLVTATGLNEESDAIFKMVPSTGKFVGEEKARVAEQQEFERTLSGTATTDWDAAYSNAVDRTAVSERRVRHEMLADYLARLRVNPDAAPAVVGGVSCARDTLVSDSTVTLMEDSQDLDEEVDWLRSAAQDVIDYGAGVAYEERLKATGYVSVEEAMEWFPAYKGLRLYLENACRSAWDNQPDVQAATTADHDYSSFSLRDWDDLRHEAAFKARAALAERQENPAAHGDLGILASLPVRMEPLYLNAMKARARSLSTEAGLTDHGDADPKGRVAGVLDRIRLTYIDQRETAPALEA